MENREPSGLQSEPRLRRELGLRDLILFSIAGLIGTRWLAAAAQTGPGSVSLWILAVLFFLIPSAICIARLSSIYPEEGGMYVWTKAYFGEWHGFLCFWLYWLGLAFWFPSFLMAITSMIIYAFAPHLAENRLYVLPASMLLLWIAIGTNLVGLKVGKWVDNIGGIASYGLGVLLIVLAAIVFFHRGSATPLHIWPQWNWSRLNFWSQIAYGLTGLELAPVLGGEIRNPSRNLPLSSYIAAPLVAAWYIVGTLALLVILLPGKISQMSGIMEVIAAGGNSIGLHWLVFAGAFFIVLAALGQLSVLGTVGARLPFVVGADAYLPRVLAKVHPRWHTPYVAILFFGGLASLFLVLAQLGETARAAYQTITDLMVIAGFIPFAYIFLAAWKCGCRASALCGLAVTAIALGASLVPTADVHVGLFELKLLGGTALLIVSARILFLHYRAKAAHLT
ncbi:MAG TPA: APC family permease [Acidobacteriaceae bacterium]|jgi:amino acid transporter|nr:APC family permease [Acidobacteriaceae bacterium]